MIGAEYTDGGCLGDLWRALDAAFDAEQAEAKLSVQEFLKSRHQPGTWLGVCIQPLAENGRDEEAPFAIWRLRHGFQLRPRRSICLLAGPCRSTRVRGTVSALSRRPAIGAAERLAPVEAPGRCGRDLSSAALEPATGAPIPEGRPRARSAGVVVRMPVSWRMNRPARLEVKGTVGGKTPTRGDGCAARLPEGGDA